MYEDYYFHAIPTKMQELLFMKRGGELIYTGPLGPNSCKLVEFFEVTELPFFASKVRLGHGGAVKESPSVHEAAWKLLKAAHGVLVPGGFGDRGVEGKILAAKYARENNVPFLGICLGMQAAIIEYARSVLKLHDANSTEFDPYTKNPCVIFMPEVSRTHMGGTMRLRLRRTYFPVYDCKAGKLYGNVDYIDERHRHRYEVNPDMIKEFESGGLVFVGRDENGDRMEILELDKILSRTKY